MPFLDERQPFLPQECRFRLRQIEIFPARNPFHRLVIPHRGTMEFFHHRAAHAAAGTHRHFNKAAMQSAMQQVFHDGQAIFSSIYRHINIILIGLFHAAQNAPRRGEQPRADALLEVRGL